jgi:hypothetical protein
MFIFKAKGSSMTSHETLIPLKAAAAWIAHRTGGHRPHVATLHRWADRGVRGVKLEVVNVGHVRFTSVEALIRFISASPKRVSTPQPNDAEQADAPPRRSCNETSGAAEELRRRIFRAATSQRHRN